MSRRYTSLNHATDRGLSFAAIENAAGRFVRPNLVSLAAAAQVLNDRPGILVPNASRPDAYPVSALSYLVVLGSDEEGTAPDPAVLRFLDWTVTSGQSANETLNYAALPPDIVREARERIARIGRRMSGLDP